MKPKNELDRIFSEYIRRRSADFAGNVKCVCCGREYHWKEIQNGHYVSRSNMNTRYDERNCHPCCVSCNVFKKGNYPEYTKYLLNNYGEDWILKLIADGKKIKKWTPGEFREAIEW